MLLNCCKFFLLVHVLHNFDNIGKQPVVTLVIPTKRIKKKKLIPQCRTIH